MQLDRTEIAIRQRGLLDLLDLSLLVLRRHWRPILLTMSFLGIPFLMIDVWAISWMLSDTAILSAEATEAPEVYVHWRYFSHLILLYTLQFQIVSLPTTLFLGNQTFYERLPLRKLLSQLRPVAWRSVWVLGVLRLSLVPLVAEFLIQRDTTFDIAWEFWLVMAAGALALFYRAGWPFAAEILGLEQCKLRNQDPRQVSYWARTRGLHSYMMSDHILRFLTSGLFGALLGAMLLGGLLFCQGVFVGSWMWGAWLNFVGIPIAMFVVGGYMAVLRFLSYLDTRIRLEGWELELRLRAEVDRMQRAAHVFTGDRPVLSDREANQPEQVAS